MHTPNHGELRLPIFVRRSDIIKGTADDNRECGQHKAVRRFMAYVLTSRSINFTHVLHIVNCNLRTQAVC